MPTPPDWGHIARACPSNAALGKIVYESLSALLDVDGVLLSRGVGERTLSARLAHHLQLRLPNYYVDCEFNRDGSAVKRLPNATVYPDIIVHRRTYDGRGNLLVAELKRSANALGGQSDKERLPRLREQFGYEHGLFVELGDGSDGKGVVDLAWF